MEFKEADQVIAFIQCSAYVFYFQASFSVMVAIVIYDYFLSNYLIDRKSIPEARCYIHRAQASSGKEVAEGKLIAD